NVQNLCCPLLRSDGITHPGLQSLRSGKDRTAMGRFLIVTAGHPPSCAFQAPTGISNLTERESVEIPAESATCWCSWVNEPDRDTAITE
ncbi:hypothetical protein, partial [Streptomyces griseoruber]|uniref:hypothetical protein n=1 Tax=Streptomyces griseoruber TaxID=1943 RepID=UPI001B80A595